MKWQSGEERKKTTPLRGKSGSLSVKWEAERERPEKKNKKAKRLDRKSGPEQAR